MIDLEKLRARASGLPDSDGAIGPTWCTPSEVLELLGMITQLEASETKLITERDHCEEVIDRMAYAVLGADRHEWTSAYDIDDAAEEVEQRIAQLEKDVDQQKGRADFWNARARVHRKARSKLFLQVRELEKDAGRYRFLCEKYDVSLLTTFFGNGCINKKIDDVNRAIDTAMEVKHG